jgi:hypothetical protein
MDNRGKIWSIDHDQMLMESPQMTNAYFGLTMGRTENAIKCRRNHLAAKMHQNDPNTPLEEYVGLMNADFAQTSALLVEWGEKKASLASFIDTNRKRKARATQDGSKTSPFFQHAAAGNAPYPSGQWDPSITDQCIEAICKSIREEGGNLVSLFNDPQFVPVLIQHYPGFEAYARIVQARALLSSK